MVALAAGLGLAFSVSGRASAALVDVEPAHARLDIVFAAFTNGTQIASLWIENVDHGARTADVYIQMSDAAVPPDQRDPYYQEIATAIGARLDTIELNAATGRVHVKGTVVSTVDDPVHPVTGSTTVTFDVVFTTIFRNAPLPSSDAPGSTHVSEKHWALADGFVRGNVATAQTRYDPPRVYVPDPRVGGVLGAGVAWDGPYFTWRLPLS